jgi:peptidoglycan/LPS O-acetylase OafA/YrhL
VPCNRARQAWRFSVELALNIAWLIVAVGLLLVCGARALSLPEKGRRITALIALACLIWLLFPVISITDDLDSGQFVFEASAVKKPNHLPNLFQALLLPASLVSAPDQTAWRETNLHADLCRITEEFFPFDLLRRPPPQ